MEEKCDHRFLHLRTESYYKPERYTNSYFLTDYFFCERCLEEKEVKKVAYDVSIYSDTPDWALGITRKVSKD